LPGGGDILVSLIGNSMVAAEAWAILNRLGYAGDAAPLAARVRRIEQGLIASEQTFWEPHNVLAAVQTPHLKGALGAQLLSGTGSKIAPSGFRSSSSIRASGTGSIAPSC